MKLKVLAASAVLALGLAATAAHAQTAAPSVDYGHIHGFFTVTDDGPDVLNVAAGDSITVSGQWSITDTSDDYCPDCVIQLYLAGLPGLPVQADLFSGIIQNGNIFNIDTFDSTSSGTYSLTFNAPTVAGAYYIGGTTSLDFQYNSVGGTGGANGDGFVNYQINVGGAAPEPATWGMMLLGFGGLGAVLRSRRARPAAGLA